MTALRNAATPLTQQQADEIDTVGYALARLSSVGGRLVLIAPEHHRVRGDSIFSRLVGDDLLDAARRTALPGDAIIVVGSRDEPLATQLTARARAWGVVAIWVCPGERPGVGAADHVIATGPLGEGNAAGGRHETEHVEATTLLTELAHAVRHHLHRADLPAPDPIGVTCTDEICVTCSDEGRWAEIIDPPKTFGEPALARTAAGIEEVDITLVGPVRPHELVLVHAGSALSVLDPMMDDDSSDFDPLGEPT